MIEDLGEVGVGLEGLVVALEVSVHYMLLPQAVSMWVDRCTFQRRNLLRFLGVRYRTLQPLNQCSAGGSHPNRRSQGKMDVQRRQLRY